MTKRGIADAVHRGELSRLRLGWYFANGGDEDRPEQRHLAAVIAASGASGQQPVFSHRTAATLHGWPVWSRWLAGENAGAAFDEQFIVHVMDPPHGRGSSARQLARHRGVLAQNDVTRVGDFRCTSANQTLLDVARTEPFPVTLACADAYLRGQMRVGREIDIESWRAWRTEMLGRADAVPRGRGVRAVRALARLAHPLADSPLESVSRLRLLQLGIDVELQVPVRSDTGGLWYLDFRFKEMPFFGEVDGKAKYLDDSLRGGRTAEEVVLAEKRRHDWISGTQQLRGLRWGAREVVSETRFSEFLMACGVAVPGRATRAYGAAVAYFLDRLPH